MAREKIMIVDGDLNTAARIENILVRRGYDIVGTASSGRDAISLAKENPPDIIVFDLMLNEQLDWVTTTAQLLSQRYHLMIYMIPDDEELIVRSKYIRPYGFITKPVDEKSLIAIIKRALIWDAWGKMDYDNISQYYPLYQEADFAIEIDTSSPLMNSKKGGTQMGKAEGVAY